MLETITEKFSNGWKKVSSEEFNNGWKKLSAVKVDEKENSFNALPKTNEYYDLVVNGNIEYRYYYGGCISSDYWVENNVTHFRLSTKHEPPIY
jgi:hypothetical protein